MTRKIIEHTYGTHIYMKMQLDDWRTEEIDVFLCNGEKHYKTSADDNPVLRQKIIDTFNELY